MNDPGAETRIQKVERVQDERLRTLLTSFEALGEDCEFGLVQRKFQSEPVGLLRWTSTRIETLIELLASEFAGLTDIDNLTMKQSAWGEYFLYDSRYGVVFHTWQKDCGGDESSFFKKQCIRLRWLRDKLLTDLQTAEKIMVYKLRFAATEEQVGRLAAELSRYGRNVLLCVDQAKVGQIAGTAKLCGTGLIRGHLGRVGPDPIAKTWNIAFDDWVGICEQTAALRAATFPPSELKWKG